MGEVQTHANESSHLYEQVNGRLARWFKVIAVTVVTLVAFEALAVSTAMPYVVSALNGERFYALASGIPMATQLITTAFAGPWCDAKGPKPVLYIGASTFIAGLIVATGAPDIYWIIVGRAIQGIGAGLLVVPLYVMIGAFIRPDKQPAFFAALSMAWIVPSLVGPSLAGLLVEYVHWRAVFAICPILFILIAPTAVVHIRQFPAIHAVTALHLGRTLWVSALLSGVVIGILQVLSGTDPAQIGTAALAVTLALSTVLFFSSRALLPRGTFALRRGVPATVALRILINGTLTATELYLLLMLKNVHHWSPTKAGLILTISSVMWALGAWIQGKITDQRQRATLFVIGPTLQLIGMLTTLIALIPGGSAWFVFFGWLVSGLGLGLAFPAAAVHALSLTPPERHGEVSSALTVADTLGAALFVAYGGIIFALTYSLGRGAFAATIIFQCVLAAFSIWVGARARVDTTDTSAGD
ncbi:MAG: MFS transporter [Actinomycetaceae bacterium]|nr:MFS transporter [Arcanobacterium sp.]MDD7686421.1 MFS transporter [Actinomycetaceae bacterium]MDY5272701.1 MFS transporter [Arcanobacterium sp.]